MTDPFWKDEAERIAAIADATRREQVLSGYSDHVQAGLRAVMRMKEPQPAANDNEAKP